MRLLAALAWMSGRSGVLLVSAATAALVLCLRWLKPGAPETHKRGTVVREPRAYKGSIGRGAKSGEPRLRLATVPVDFQDETKHFKIIGTTGTGKSTAIHELLSSALERGDRAIFADPDGAYLSSLFTRYRGDVILNPFEPGSVGWNPFAELRDPFDVEQLASGLIPTSGDPSAGEWRGYARTFLCALLRKLRGRRQNSVELWRMVSAATAEELKPLVAGTPAQSFLDAENARMFGSIRSVAVSALAAFEHVQAQRAAPFSIRSWVRRPTAAGALFFPYKAAQIAALRSMIATWMRLAIFEAMSGEEGFDQRLWFVVDELDALGAMDGLKDALARLRKFGGRCVLGFQSLAQVSGTYGAADAQTILENCSNSLILRCSGSEYGGTSQFASRLIGEREILRRQVSLGSDRSAALIARGSRRSKSTSDQHVTEAAVMPSQIEQLPDFCGYLKTASSPEWLKVSFAHGRSRRERRR